MPITPDMPATPDDDGPEPGKPGRRNGADRAGTGGETAASAANDADHDDTLGDAAEIYASESDEDLEGAGQGICDLVRDNPVGALLGAFVAGFLVSRLI